MSPRDRHLFLGGHGTRMGQLAACTSLQDVHLYLHSGKGGRRADLRSIRNVLWTDLARVAENAIGTGLQHLLSNILMAERQVAGSLGKNSAGREQEHDRGDGGPMHDRPL